MPDLSKKKVVDAIRPEAVRRLVWDSRPGRVGFGLDVWPSGKRSWIYQYRTREHVQRRMTLGNADLLTPVQADAMYQELAVQVLQGRDPLTERRTRRATRAAAPTCAEVAARYLATLRTTKSARWATEADRLWTKHLAAPLGKKKVQDVTADDVRTLHERMADTPALANRVKAVVGAVLSRAMQDGQHAGPNPAAAVADYAERARERYLTDTEWPRLAQAFVTVRAFLAMPGRGDTRLAQLDAIVLLLLTGARRDALRLRQWADLDLAARVLRVQPAHKGTDRIVLGRAALAYVRWMRRQTPDPHGFLFPGTRGRPVASLNVTWTLLREAAGLEDVTLHDLRRSFATVAGDVGVSDHLIGGLLGHVVPGIRKRYAHRTDPALLEAADRVSREVRRRLTPRTSR